MRGSLSHVSVANRGPSILPIVARRSSHRRMEELCLDVDVDAA
jgi:hypothetical protein